MQKYNTKEIAKIKNISYEEVEQTTTKNAINLFMLKISANAKPEEILK